ncbi:MAG TPA: hypothetical protein VFB79_15900 [Candidatus Angelobacter sp.]|nr:hypothetical protein [Candidatus Angelobacter sp.]
MTVMSKPLTWLKHGPAHLHGLIRHKKTALIALLNVMNAKGVYANAIMAPRVAEAQGKEKLAKSLAGA